MYVTLDRLADAAANFFVDVLQPRISYTFGVAQQQMYPKDVLAASLVPIIKSYYPTLEREGYLSPEKNRVNITKAREMLDAKFKKTPSISFSVLGKPIFITKDDIDTFFKYLIDYIDNEAPITLGYSK